jgi:hypothetical protein
MSGSLDDRTGAKSPSDAQPGASAADANLPVKRLVCRPGPVQNNIQGFACITAHPPGKSAEVNSREEPGLMLTRDRSRYPESFRSSKAGKDRSRFCCAAGGQAV